MVTTYTLQEDFPAPHSAIKQLIQGPWNWKSSGAVIGLCGGLVTPIFGAVVTVISWFIDPVWHGVFLHQVGTSLFFLAIPLLIFGAHCLDLLDKEKKLTQASQLLERDEASAGEKGHNDDLERD